VLTGKLFAALAGIALVIAILGRMRVLPHANLWLRTGHFSFDAFYWQVFIAAVCAFCAFAYFAGVQITRRSPHQMTGLAGFLLIASASAIWLVSCFIPPSHRAIVPLFVAILLFVLGLAISAANVVWVFLYQ
jgi:hypothetical protein